MSNPVLVALDVPDIDSAETLASAVRPHVGGFKVGLELIMNHGPDAVSHIAALGLPVFADVKLHDIPNTVGKAARALAGRGARWVTVHAAGGAAMLEAAVEGMGPDCGALAVTVLTSLDGRDLLDVGQGGDITSQVERLAGLASRTGAEGVICSPSDVSSVKGVDPGLLAVTPGIRIEGGQTQDQKRVATPAGAVRAGADYLVIGRSITRSGDPAATAASIQLSP